MGVYSRIKLSTDETYPGERGREVTMDDKPLIDWFTVVAQIINFLILVLVLKYLLYGKIIAAMDERQRKIADRFEEADQREKNADQKLQEYQQRILEIHESRDMALALAQHDVDRQKQQWLHNSRREFEEQRTRWYDALQEESTAYLDELRTKIADSALHIAKSTLADLADTELEAGIVNTFLRRLHALTEFERGTVLESLQNSNGQLLIQSAFPLSPNLQDKVCRDLTSLIPGNRDFVFETHPDLICGIRLATADQHILWELGRRLEEVTDIIRTSVERSEKPKQETEVNHGLHV